MGTISLNPDNYLLKVLVCPFHRLERESQKGKVIGQDHTPKENNRVKFESAHVTLGPMLSSIEQNIFLPISRFLRETALSLKMCVSCSFPWDTWDSFHFQISKQFPVLRVYSLLQKEL